MGTLPEMGNGKGTSEAIFGDKCHSFRRNADSRVVLGNASPRVCNGLQSIFALIECAMTPAKRALMDDLEAGHARESRAWTRCPCALLQWIERPCDRRSTGVTFPAATVVSRLLQDARGFLGSVQADGHELGGWRVAANANALQRYQRVGFRVVGSSLAGWDIEGQQLSLIHI